MDFNNIQSYSQEELEDILDEASDKYYNTNKLTLTDQEFDCIKEYLINVFPKTKYKKQIGCDSSGKIKLPVWMGSMDNLKSEKQINNWISKYPENYVIMSKLDGISALLYKEGACTKLFTRGNGTMGKDISHLLKYLKIPDLSSYTNITVRGELLVQKELYKHIKSDSANERSFVSGIVNSKKINKYVKFVDFVAYELMYPEFKISDQLKKLSKLGFNTVLNKTCKNIDYKFLQEELKTQKDKSIYLIDGIIIRHNENYSYNKSGNPKFAIAFKMIFEEQVKQTKVIQVHWNVSKLGKLFPQVEIKPVKIGGNTIKFASGKSAQFIYKNKIGPGAIVNIARSCDVIPDIVEVINPAATPQMPETEYKWNKTKVDIFSIDEEDNEDINLKLIEDFFKKINTANMGPGNIAKLYEYGYDTIKKILNIKKSQLLEIPGFKETSATKIIENIKNSINEASIIDIMNASNVFGRGFGRKKLDLLFQNIPDIMDRDADEDLIETIEDIDGFSSILAEQFVDNFNKFKKFLKHLNINTHNLNNYIPDKKCDKNIVFTGFRHSEFESQLKHKNIDVSDSINSKTILVVRKDNSVESKKIKDARSKKIKIMNLNDFTKYITCL